MVGLESESPSIIRSTTLPGFQLRQWDLSTKPRIEQLAKDPVYQGYLLLQYEEALAQMEAEHQRAESLATELEQARAELAKLPSETNDD